MVSPSVVWNFASPGIAFAMLSRFFSRIAVTELSLSSVGASFSSFSRIRPDSCCASADV